ncbi:hypothetical protein [Galenea microaerophila]
MKRSEFFLNIRSSLIKQVGLMFIVGFICLWSMIVSAETNINEGALILEKMSSHKWLLLPEQRQKIEHEREKHLKSLLKSENEVTTTASVKKKIHHKPVRYFLRSVIIDSDGKAQIQLNSRWYKSENSPIPFKIDPTHPALIQVTIGNRIWKVPVGSTLILDKHLGGLLIQPLSKVDIKTSTQSP